MDIMQSVEIYQWKRLKTYKNKDKWVLRLKSMGDFNKK